MSNTSKLVRMRLKNIGCVGNDGITIALDNIVCLVGKNNAGKSTILRAYELVYCFRKNQLLTNVKFKFYQ
ncbi:AAA family ATPase [Pseudomonas syringae group genomosp. 3]|uniref:Relaxase n=1 Tax=Pseudomonas syringae pv. viburni TaxID=251703 RepID=A0A0Q0JA59_9PSED|nr:AAA family ATPase [Pseudomonas syringae group genomosp. 3]KPZ11107.1 hypothetical protein ALO40_200162 [Pseudomonas syringae pv. viburni]